MNKQATPTDSENEPPQMAEETPRKPGPAHIHRFATVEELAVAAANQFLEVAKRAVEKNGRFVVVLSGGNTPAPLYRLLADAPYRDQVPWDRTFFVFSDERCVPPDDEASNYRLVYETLLAPLEIPEHHVLRMKGEQVPADAARRYLVRLDDLFLNQPKRHFDLALLGIGADGHTASLFPGTDALNESERWAVACEVPQLGAWRLTLTFPALNSSRRVLFLVAGAAKAQVVAEAFGGAEHDPPHPCEGVAPFHARREVLVDLEAASQLAPRRAELAPRTPSTPSTGEAETAETTDETDL
jgi:6-phosphogluconolactonase